MESVPVEEVVFRAPPGYCHVCNLYIPDGEFYLYLFIPSQKREGLLCDICWGVVEPVLKLLHARAIQIEEEVSERFWATE